MNDTKALFTSHKNQHKPSEQGLALVPDNIIRQELITYSLTEDGLKRTTCSRVFRQSTHDESVVQENLRGPK